MKKSAMQRVEEFRAKADILEARDRRRRERQSPEWKATLRAIENIILASNCLQNKSGPHYKALQLAGSALVEARTQLIDEPVQ